MRDDRPPKGQWSGRSTRRVRAPKSDPRSKAALTVLLAAVSAAVLVALPAGAEKAAADVSNPIYLDTGYSFGERAADLVARLTPSQRASQLVSSQAPAISSPLLSSSFTTGSTTLAGPAGAGDTNLKVASVAGMSAGAVLAVDPAGTPESVTVTAVGTAAATATTLPAGAKAGDTNLKVASVAGMTVGHLVRVDAGASIEVPTVAAVGTAASTATTLAAAAAAGATNIKVTSVTGMTAGHQIRVDTGANLEVDTIAAVGTAGSAGTGITLTAPLVSHTRPARRLRTSARA